jgi:tetratricopeptide (TPR) repeat protein
MKRLIVSSIILAIAIPPVQSFAQRGGNRGGERGNSGGFRGGGMGNGGGSPGGGRASGGSNRGPDGGNGGGEFHGRNAGGGSLGRGARTASNPQPSRPSRSINQQFASRNAAIGHRPGYQGSWYHGDWHGYWARPYAYRPWGWYGGGVRWGLEFGFGVGGASVGVVSLASPWGWGYYSYYNPYWVVPVGSVTYINYSQPVVAAPIPAVAAQTGNQPAYQAALPPSSDAAGQPSAAQSNALAMFDSARGFFKRGDYAMALSQTNRALGLTPNDSLMHEFRALCLFATQDYQQAAAAIHAVLASGPGWDMTTLVGLYPSQAIYNEQLRALENYRAEHPNAGAPRFLLAYHHTLAGRNDRATAELEAVVKLEPHDQLAAQLLKGLTTGPQEKPASVPPQAPERPVDAASLLGSWRAERPDGSKFALTLAPGKTFRWSFTQQDKQQQLAGTYTLADSYLILTARDQNALIGHVAQAGVDRFAFKLAGGSPDDPGLIFTR